MGPGAPAAARERRHLQRVRRPARHRPALGARSRCRSCSPPDEWQGARSRARAARAAAQPHPGRPLRPAAPAARRPPAARAAVGPSGLPAAVPRRRRARSAATCTSSAVDLARAPDGRWWVLADRTQAPSGAGYALENRIVLSRALPELFRECRVQRLAGFFRALRETLRALAPRHRENPRIVAAHARAPTTRPTSSTPTWPATSATRWSRAPTSRCATRRSS